MRSRTLLCLITLAFGVLLSSRPVAAADEPSLDLLAEFVDLEDLKGRVIYVDFWASWCAPCQKSFPWMAQLHQEHAEDGLIILAVNVDRETAAADRFLTAHQVPFRILRDPEGKLASAFDLKAMPTAFVFDRDGDFAWEHAGFRESEVEEVAKRLEELLGVQAEEES